LSNVGDLRPNSKTHLGHNQISVVQRSSVKLHKDIIGAQFGDLIFGIEFQALKAILALDSPGFGSLWD
jgi:hypothetical protein